VGVLRQRVPQAQVSLPQTLQAAVGRFPSDPSVIVFDGRLHHYDVEGDRRGRKNGWFVFYPTAALFGSFGSWKTGHTHTWRAGLDETLTPEQQARRQREMAAIRARRAEEERVLHAQARTRLPGGRGRGPPWPPIILTCSKSKYPPSACISCEICWWCRCATGKGAPSRCAGVAAPGR